MENEDWKKKATLVWRGKIIENLNTGCEHGDFLCEFECDYVEPFRLKICSRIFIQGGEKVNDIVSIPMKFWMDGKLYDPAAEDTPVTVRK